MQGIKLDITQIPTHATTMIAGGLSRFAGDIRSVRVPLERAVDQVVRPQISENFASQSAAGDSWVSLADATPDLDYRQSHNAAGAPMLDVTGKLKEQAQLKKLWKFDGQAGEAFIPAGAFAGSPVEDYAYSMQFGGPNIRGYRDVPARPYIAVNEQNLEEIDRIFEEWIGERLNIAMSASAAGAMAGRWGR